MSQRRSQNSSSTYGEWDIPLKNKAFYKERYQKLRKKDEFRHFKAKMLYRMVWMVVFALFAIIMLYSFFLQGRFADWIVKVYQKLFRLEYATARSLYQWTLRNHIEIVFYVAIVILFILIFRLYLNWFMKYFTQINEGMDNLVREDASEVSLSPELYAIERKMNAVKHTIVMQNNERQAEEQKKNDLIMYLAHDLKTPLASVIGYLNLLRDEEEISEELRKKYLAVSLDKAERLEDLIDEFFEIAKYNLSYITLQYNRINLKRLFEMLLYEFAPMLQENDLTCRLQIEEDVMLRCDADKMQRVFDNLLRNAVYYSYGGTEIGITATCQNGETEIRFTNHGDVLSEEKIERMFERFTRLDTSRSTDKGGAGLGLAIARQIIELHGGVITVQSEDDIITFVIKLPA